MSLDHATRARGPACLAGFARAGWRTWGSLALGLSLIASCGGGESLADSVTIVYESDTVLKNPECVVFDVARDCYYISNLNERGVTKDGFISRFTLPDRLELRWIESLDDPRGLAVQGDVLVVADNTDIHRINILEPSSVETVSIDGAVALNDVALNGARIFTTDFKGNAVYSLEGDSAERLAVEMASPNGIAVDGGTLYIGAFAGSSKLVAYGLEDGMTRVIGGADSQNIDGLTVLSDGRFLTSNFSDRLQLRNGPTVTNLLTTKGKNVCDFAFDEAESIIVYPSMNGSYLRVLRVEL